MKRFFFIDMIMIIAAFLFSGCNHTKPKENAAASASYSSAMDTLSLPIQVRSRKLTIQDGLPSNSIVSIYQDQKGFVWLGTHNGLARYDGNKMVVFSHDSTASSLDDNRIKYIKEDTLNRCVWLYCASEVFTCLSLKTGKTLDYTGGSPKLHYTYSQIVNAGEIWLYGKKEGALRVCQHNGTFKTEQFGRNNIGSDNITLFSRLDSARMLLCTPDRMYIHENGKLRMAYSGKGFVSTKKIGSRQLLISKDGCVYELHGDKVKFMLNIGFDKKQSYVDDITRKGSWMIFTNEGCYCVNVNNATVRRCTGEWDISNGKVLTDNKGRRWIYNKTGILRLVTDKGLTSLNLLPEGETNYIDYERYHIVEDRHGLIWISTYGNGLFVFSKDLKKSQHFIANSDGESPIASDHLLDMVADKNGSIWVSSEFGGIAHIQVLQQATERIFPDESKQMNFSNVVRMVSKTKDGNIFVSTRAGWLYEYSPDMKQLKSKKRFDSNVYAVNETKDGNTWIGTRGKGIYGIDGLSYKNHNVFCLAPDKKNRMWIGTYGDGLSVAWRNGSEYSTKSMFRDSVGMNEVRCMKADRNGWIWMGTTGGLIVFNPDKFIGNATAYYTYEKGSEVHDIMIDHLNRIWITLPGKGVSMTECGNGRYDQLKFRHYDQSNGLVNNMTQSIVEDKNGNYWISTQQGVSCFNPQKNTIDNYYLDPNQMGNVYNENSAVCLNDGRILLGGYYGLTLITPDKLHHSNEKMNIVFTSQPYTDMMELNYDDNSPVIDFSTLDYSDVKNVKYTYWLEGYDKNWSPISSNASAAYNNLPAGRYRLHAKACNSDGRWGKESILNIVVNPPFYLSAWAICLYIIAAGLAIYFAIKNINEKKELRNKVRIEQELTKYKLSFFTNIAHEFRTPLTLIAGSIEKESRIVKANHWQGELDKSIHTMNKSVKRMLRLIDQLLEFRKMQAGKLTLALQETDIVYFVRELCHTFDDSAESKDIKYTFKSTENAHIMFVDKRHIDKIVFNLLSNAFKYTPSGGSISVNLSFGDMLTISISDTGVGIPTEKRSELFSRFMQSSYTGESFGIGLHLTKELVTVHHGTIEYKENNGGGSVFTVKMPTDKNVYDKADFLIKDNPILKDEIKATVPAEIPSADEQTDNTQPLNKKVILLVEDDNDVRDFLVEELRDYFTVETETDGKSGIAKAKDTDVDLIISDVMMPEMNGFELTKRLKNNFETSHIPIILLTALSNEESHLEGTESGADAYMTKPFSPQLLVARIFQLLDQREKLKQKFSKSLEEVRPSLCATEQDNVFARRLNAVIESKISDRNLSVETIADSLHIGRTIFYRKVRGITGYTPNEYIRVMRLKHAAELLKSGEKNVSEVAYEVGFDNPYYFSKCFKDQFGIPPSKYRE
jgi:signal transduction histidine kinase/ligand-binding sensor domain-containing protein/AraC-like DNA-binding protein